MADIIPVTFHLLTVIVNLKLWLHARYHTLLFVLSVVLSIVVYILFNTAYSFIYLQIDGDVLGTYIRLLQSPGFMFLNLVVVIACLLPDFVVRILSERLVRMRILQRPTEPDVFITSL
uniref:SFRICE_021419 n=1 Tax=Spodoptera frugiperda TaxID=7108 RepID=A0A2H1WET8_SPOFR